VYGYPRRRPGPPWFILAAVAILVGIVAVIVVLALTGAFGGPPSRPFLGVWGGFLLIFLLLWVAFFVIRVMFWSRAWRGRGAGYAHPDPAVMVARRRYARGEITREQYDQILSDLDRRQPRS
jgi:uncharacterized membrane protein